MIHLVTSENLHLFASQLDQMFAMRPEPRSDVLDDEYAIYLLAADVHGQVDASLRLRAGPDERQRLTASRCARRPLLPAEREPPADPLAELMLGLLEFCEARHVTRVEIAPEPRLQASLKRLDCVVEEDPAGARWLAPSSAMLASARNAAGVRAPVLAPGAAKREQPGLSAGLSR